MGFCPICGNEAVDVFCEQHVREQTPLISNIKPVVLTHCSNCDRIKAGNSWHKLDDFDRYFKKHITFAKNAVIVRVEFPTPVVEDKEKEFVLPLVVEGSVSGAIEPYEEEYEVPVQVAYENCDRCALAKSSYFEGTLQIRNPNEAVVRFIEKTVASNPEVQITKAEDVRGGMDFQITDQKWLQWFVHDIRKRFGGVAKTHSKLHTYDHQKSKPVYRLTGLVRLPSFDKGDIIETEKKLLRITHMGSVLRGFDLRFRKNTGMPCPSDEEVTILESVKAVVSAQRPKLTILHPETYQEVPVATDAPAQPGTTVRAVQDTRGKWYLVEDDDYLARTE